MTQGALAPCGVCCPVLPGVLRNHGESNEKVFLTSLDEAPTKPDPEYIGYGFFSLKSVLTPLPLAVKVPLVLIGGRTHAPCPDDTNLCLMNQNSITINSAS